MKYIIQNQNRYLMFVPIGLIAVSMVFMVLDMPIGICVSLVAAILLLITVFLPTVVITDMEQVKIRGPFKIQNINISDVESVTYEHFTETIRRKGTHDRRVRMVISLKNSKEIVLCDKAASDFLLVSAEKEDADIPLYKIYTVLAMRTGQQK